MEVDHYLQVLPSSERHILKHCVQLLQTQKEITQTHHDTVTRMISRWPYPIIQILQHTDEKPKHSIERLIADALQRLLKTDSNEFSLQFINFLVNFPIRILATTSFRYKLPQILAKSKLSDEVYLALLCRTETKLLDDVLVYLQRQWSNCDYFSSKEYVLLQALNNKQHFIPCISTELKDFRSIQNIAIRNNLLILKVANEFSESSQTLSEMGNISKWLEDFVVSESPADLQEIHNFFLADFKRMCAMLNFLKEQTENYKIIKVSALLSSSGILRLLFDYNIQTSFLETYSIMETMYKLQHSIPAAKSVRDTELEIFTYYSSLSIVFDVVVSDVIPNSDQYYASQMQKLNVMLRHIRNMDTLCSLIEDIFRLVFLRWEHLRKDNGKSVTGKSSDFMTQNSKAKSDDSAETTDYDDAVIESTVRSPVTNTSMTLRHGFICRGQALHTVFVFLKNCVTKKLHTEDYRDASEYIQMRFQKIIEIISEALWKYSVLEKIDDSLFRAGVHPQHMLEAEDLLQLVQLHVHPMDKSSSDDDSRDRTKYTSLTRRKTSKKRRRATFSGALVTRNGTTMNLDQYRARASIMISSVSEVQGATDLVTQLKARNMVSHFMDRGIIPKMLGSPENLAIMALALKNFGDVKHIIETFNLKNTDLNRELLFVEQQQQVKQKLNTIYTNYRSQEAHSSKGSTQKKPKATVDQIKNVAGKGFEVSKIINVIDNFAQMQKIKQSNELKQLLQKYSGIPKYYFLRHFDEDHLNVVIITDLILNLPFNREICVNIVIDIKRQQFNAGIPTCTTPKGDAPARSQLPREIGPMYLLENLSECLRMLEHKSLHNLLSDNYYSLKPHNLNMELQREHAFQKVFYKTAAEIGHCENLKGHNSLFQNLQSKSDYYLRFSTYVMHFGRLVRLRDPHLDYHTNELLKIDPYNIIGELIFERNMTPLEIESNVSALNLNLVHVIALNICPEIAGRWHTNARTATSQKLNTIINYIANHNQLLAYVLHGTNRLDLGQAHTSMNSTFLQRFVGLYEIRQLSSLYKGNNFIAALRSDNLDRQILKRLHSQRDELDILLLQMGTQASRVGIANEIDKMVVNLIREDSKNIQLATHLHNVHLRAKLLQANFTKIPTTRLAKELIETTLQHKYATAEIPHHLLHQLESTLADITVYAKVSEVMQFETWPQAYDFGLKTPNAIFQKLLSMHLYKLCYKWCKVVKLAERCNQFKKSFLSVLLDALLDLTDEQSEGLEVNKYLLQILETFPLEDCLSFLDAHKDKFRSVELLQYTINFLVKNSSVPDSYRNYKISLTIFEQLMPSERDQFWNLFKYPLLIVEQLIMNAKFESLTKVLEVVRKSLQYNGEKMHLCSFCFDKRGNIYDVHTKASISPHKPRFQLGTDAANTTTSAFILLNFNLYQNDHIITNECIDLLLRIYATKALDYHISDASSSSERISQTTDIQQSLDSLCGAFQMPKYAPSRTDWIRDEEATHCMCCRRAAFTMLMRRHHCRRCGRVVCFACSTHRMRIPELYEDVEVRICNDCQHITGESQQRKAARSTMEKDNATQPHLPDSAELFKWKLSGNITHDKLVREEFCYDHAPSVALCLSILGFHLGQQKCVELLLYHCRELEKLIIPNPEVDYELVAKMMNCLALAAKVRGGPAEVETIREHSEIIMSVVQNGCEALIPPGPLNKHSLRRLADSLVQAENWQLALEVHLKCGFPTAGVMAANGLSCLRAGCFDTAREKFSHCMPKLSNELANSIIYKAILCPNTGSGNESTNASAKPVDIPHIKRPQRGPPLLQEILKLIESPPALRPQPETLQRASIIRSSNSSLASMLTRRKEFYATPMHEPAMNVLTSLANLKRIAKGQYSEANAECNNWILLRHSRGFEECIHYVLTYGSHVDIIRFLMRYDELKAVLKYLIAQNLEPDYFIHNVFMIMLHYGQLPMLIVSMQQFDEHLLIWRNTLLQTCRYLETQNLLHSLYELQILLKDPVRASMTCVKFYTMNCENFQQLHANAEHLHNAHKHLQSELEMAQWENISLDNLPAKRKISPASRRGSTASATPSNFNATTFLMQMDARSLNTHINTFLKQLDVTKFLAKCEKENTTEDGLVTEKYLKLIRIDSDKSPLPTLFDSTQSKIQTCILILLCGKNIDEGFGLAYGIIQDYKLQPIKIYGATAKYLARSDRLPEVEKLINCITSNNGISTREIDEILSIAINAAINTHEPEVKASLDALVKRIHNVELRISSHIFIGQLKSAYLLANKHERLADIRRILRQAELTNQMHIKKLCERKLNMHSSQPKGL